jgi:hypothetical protein
VAGRAPRRSRVPCSSAGRAQQFRLVRRPSLTGGHQGRSTVGGGDRALPRVAGPVRSQATFRHACRWSLSPKDGRASTPSRVGPNRLGAERSASALPLGPDSATRQTLDLAHGGVGDRTRLRVGAANAAPAGIQEATNGFRGNVSRSRGWTDWCSGRPLASSTRRARLGQFGKGRATRAREPTRVLFVPRVPRGTESRSGSSGAAYVDPGGQRLGGLGRPHSAAQAFGRTLGARRWTRSVVASIPVPRGTRSRTLR